MIRNWHRALIRSSSKTLGRPLTPQEKLFITSRRSLVALETIDDTIKSSSPEQLVAYLRSDNESLPGQADDCLKADPDNRPMRGMLPTGIAFALMGLFLMAWSVIDGWEIMQLRLWGEDVKATVLETGYAPGGSDFSSDYYVRVAIPKTGGESGESVVGTVWYLRPPEIEPGMEIPAKFRREKPEGFLLLDRLGWGELLMNFFGFFCGLLLHLFGVLMVAARSVKSKPPLR